MRSTAILAGADNIVPANEHHPGRPHHQLPRRPGPSARPADVIVGKDTLLR